MTLKGGPGTNKDDRHEHLLVGNKSWGWEKYLGGGGACGSSSSEDYLEDPPSVNNPLIERVLQQVDHDGYYQEVNAAILDHKTSQSTFSC
jgi:hypothetical protein